MDGYMQIHFVVVGGRISLRDMFEGKREEMKTSQSLIETVLLQSSLRSFPSFPRFSSSPLPPLLLHLHLFMDSVNFT